MSQLRQNIFVRSDVYLDKVFLKALLLILTREAFNGQRVNF